MSAPFSAVTRCLALLFLFHTVPAQAAQQIYFTAGNATAANDALLKVNADGTGQTTVASGAASFSQPESVAIDPAAGYVFVTDGNGGQKILRFNLDGTGRTVVYDVTSDGNIGIPKSIALDRVNQRIYFTTVSGTAADDRLMRLSSYNAGAAATTLLSGSSNFASPAGMALDPARGYIYINDSTTLSSQGLLRFNLDGTGRTVIASNATLFPGGSGLGGQVAVEPASGDLFVCLAGSTASDDRLIRVTAPGSGNTISTIASGATSFTQPYGLTLDPHNSYLYVGDNNPSGTQALLRFKLDGTGRTVIGNTLAAGSPVNGVALLPPDYAVDTTSTTITVTDLTGNGDTLTVSQSIAGSNISFAAPGRTFSLNGGANLSGSSGSLSFTGKTLVTVNAAGGNDTVTFSGNITFPSGTSLEVNGGTVGADNITFAADAAVTLSGAGAATLKVSQGIVFFSGSSLTTANGPITVEANQQDTPTSGNFTAINLQGTVQSTGGGQVTLKGKGGDGGGYGIYIPSSGIVMGGTSGTTLLIQATGNGIGLYTEGSISSNGGNVTVNGTGGSGTGGSLHGITQRGGIISSGGGDVTVLGISEASAGPNSYGVYLENSITAGGMGKVKVVGTAKGTAGDGYYGITLRIGTSKITSSGGSITLIGTGGGATGSSSNLGVNIAGGNVIGGGSSGSVLIQGTGGGGGTGGSFNPGVMMYPDATVTSNGGDITIEGASRRIGESGILLIGTVTTATNGGNITLIGDKMDVRVSVTAKPTATVTLKPKTPAFPINLGSGSTATALGLPDGILDSITTGTLVIGDSATGPITVAGDISRAAATSMQLISSGDISFTTGHVDTGGGTLLLDAGSSATTAVKPGASGTDVTTGATSALSFGSGGALSLDISGNTVDTGYQQLKVAGKVNLTGTALQLTGGYIPLAGDSFTLVDNDGADAITGTFSRADGSSIANGSTVSFNEVPLKILYNGGDGNDVVLIGLPTITSISPASGSIFGGQSVTITGTNLAGVSRVTFGGTDATLGTNTGTSIVVTTPTGSAGARDVVVTTSGGSVTSAGGYTYIDLPAVTGISPASGSTAGGNIVTLTGTNFTGATGVTIGGAAATAVSVVNATSITATTPAGTAGSASVVVTTPVGSNKANTLYTYVAPPTVTSISPASGLVAGGTVVTITGTGFTGGAGLTIGGKAATAVSVVNASTITATTPSGTAGSASVVVTTPGGSNAANTLYTYAAPPTITSISPASGSIFGGQSVTITGTNLAGVTKVTFGGAAATPGTNTSTSMVVTTPTGSAGARDVVLTTPGGAVTSAGGYTYVDIPTVTSITPAGGSTAGGNIVTLTGTNFTGATGVTIGGAAATAVSVVNATSITATTPAGTAGSASVVVTTPVGSNKANTLYTYVAPPTVTSISPPSGPVAGGTVVTITGTGFTGGAGLTIGGAAATAVSVVNATTITATTPSGTAGSASVVVTTPGGSNAANTLYTYAAPPTITSISPASGSIFGGQSVTITGTNLAGVIKVTFGGAAATPGTNTSTSMVVTTPTGTAGARDVVLTTPGGAVTSAGGYTYVDIPTVISITPAGGSTAGGTPVTITGTNFTGATGVAIGGTPATGVTVVNATTITATTPSGTVGTASVVVTTVGGSNAANTLFTYIAPPTVTSITPARGGAAGGTPVTITGTNLTGATGVTIGGTPATAVSVVNATTITATAPAGTAGTASVVVTTPGGSNAANTLYTYIAPPTVGAISPASGSTAGGTGVTITGSNFTGATGVTIGGTPATGVTVVNATTLTATTPSGTAGSASVVVTTPGGSNAANTLYTYIAPPTVSAISPASGSTAGGTRVTITGTSLTGATGVTIGGTPATGVTVVNATSITATTPSGTAGSASVEVTTPVGSSKANTLYTYVAPPTVTSISPASGPVAGGTVVTITGTGFTGGAGLTIGGAAATAVSVVNSTTITATTPSGTAGSASVVVATPGGGNAANTLYTYAGTPTITSISPASGSIFGGQSVTITGTNLAGVTKVTFGGAAATPGTNTSTSMVVTTPTGSAGARDVVLTTPGGAVTSAGGYTYIDLPAVTGISPASGSTAGGNIVTLTGTNFTGATGVTIGGAAATAVSVVNATSITATTPAGTAGSASVVVTTPVGSNKANTLYTYVAPPTVTSISPASGPVAGGTVVSITGTGFTGATGVTIGGKAATAVSVVNATSITATTPSGTAGSASVVVTTPGGSNGANTLYTYAVAPTITSISPASGSIFGGQSVTITGTNLAGVTKVTFGGAAATPGTNTSTSMVVTTPTGSAGARDVVVTTPGGSATSTGGYTYIDLPTVTGISPASGSTGGGTSVTLTGTNFTGATGVTIGGTPATGVTVVNATSITATTPAGTAGSASVVVTTPVGSNKANTLYTYVAPPTVTSISPASGPVAGGTLVIITGTGFTGATGVTIGGKATIGFTVVNSSTSITTTVPAGTEGSASVVVTTPGGSNAPNTLYTYANQAPTLSSIPDKSIPFGSGASSQSFVIGDTETAASALTVSAISGNTALVPNAPANLAFGGSGSNRTLTVTPVAGQAGTAKITVTVSDGSLSTSDDFLFTVAPPADYVVASSSGNLSVTDNTGNSDTLTISEPSPGKIRFAASGAAIRTFSVNGAAITNDNSGDLDLTGITKVTVNAGAGNDLLNVGAFTAVFPASLTLNGGTGDDTVNFNGSLTFAANASLDVDLQNDDSTPGTDSITFGANAQVTLSGTGAARLSVNRSIFFASGSSLTTVDGAITLEANQQATPTTGSFYGAEIHGIVQATGAGTVTVNVRGGDVAGGNVGLVMRSGGGIKGGSSGAVVVNATGGAGGDGAYGISMNSGAIQSTGASVTVTGQGGGTGAATNGRGIQMEGDGLIAADGAGSVTVTAIAGPGTGGGYSGIGFYGSSSITTAQGVLQVAGTAGSGAGNQYGIEMGGGSISASGPAGSVRLRGTGGIGGNVNHGIVLAGSASLTSGGGDISLEGTEGTGGYSVGIDMYDNPSAHISTLAHGGNILLTADRIALDSSGTTTALITAPSGAAVTLKPRTIGRTILLGSYSTPDVSGHIDAELDRISAGTIVIGDSAAGPLTVTADITRAAATNLKLISGGDITFTTGHIDTGGGSLLLDSGSAPAAVRPQVAGTDATASTVSFAPGGTLALTIMDTATYDQLTVSGDVSLTGSSLTLSGGYVPVGADSFILVDNRGPHPITGTFTDLGEGAILLFNTVEMSISYHGGDGGNDVVLTRVNQVPVISQVAATTTDEDTPTSPAIAFTVGDDSTAPGSLTLAASSSNPSLVPNAVANLALGGSGANRTLTITPAANASGQATITLTVTDAGGLTATDSFVLTVNPVNDAPTLDAIGSPPAIAENSARQTLSFTGVSAGGGENQILTLSAVSDNPSLIPDPAVAYTSPGTTGSLTYTPAPDSSGSALITLTVSDGQAKVSRSFTVVVTPVNHPPVLASMMGYGDIDEDAGPQTVTLSGISPGAGEVLGSQTLTITAVSSNPALIPDPVVTYHSPDSTGSLSYQPSPNASGSTTITVTIDDGQSVNHASVRIFNVTVYPVNDRPSFTGGADQIILLPADGGGGPHSVPAWATDISDGDPEAFQSLSFHLSLSGDSSIFSTPPTLSASGDLSFELNGTAGQVTVSVILTDDDSIHGTAALSSLPVSFTISANHAPIAAPDLLGTIQDVPATVLARKFALNDRDPDGDAISITAVSAVSAHGAVALNAGNILYTPAAGYTGDDSFTYTLTDARGATAIGLVNVIVTSKDELSRNSYIRKTPDGCQLRFAGIPGDRYIIQYSSDLSHWQNLTDPVTADENGIIEYTDNPQPAPPSRFYRTIATPALPPAPGN